MKHALILRLLNVPLFTALFGSLVMIGLDTMQGDKTAHAKRPSAIPHDDSSSEIVGTAPVVELSTVEVNESRSQPTVDPQKLARIEEMLDNVEVVDQSTEAETKRVVEVEDTTNEIVTDAKQTTVAGSTTEPDTQIVGLEPQPTAAQPTSLTDQEEAAETVAASEGNQATDHAGFPSDFTSNETNDSGGTSVVETNNSSLPTASPIAEGILRRRAERQRRLAEQARAAAEARRQQAEALEKKTATTPNVEVTDSGESFAGESASQIAKHEDNTNHSTTLRGEIRLSNANDSTGDVVFLLGKQVRKLAPGQTTIINQDTTLRFDRGGSFGAATEQLVLGRSYEFQVNARGWSVVQNPTVGNAATE